MGFYLNSITLEFITGCMFLTYHQKETRFFYKKGCPSGEASMPHMRGGKGDGILAYSEPLPTKQMRY